MEEKKIFILVQRLFFCLMCCLTCFEANSFRRNINCIFCTVTDVSMAVVLWKYYGSESSDRLERKGLYIQQRRMVECLNKRVQFRSGWYKYSEGFFFFVNEKMLETRKFIFTTLFTTFFFDYIQALLFSPFYLGTFLKVDIDIITTPMRSHLTQLPSVFYAEQSGGELR